MSHINVIIVDAIAATVNLEFPGKGIDIVLDVARYCHVTLR